MAERTKMSEPIQMFDSRLKNKFMLFFFVRSNRFHVKPMMWVKALDILFDRLVVNGAQLNTVAAISG